MRISTPCRESDMILVKKWYFYLTFLGACSLLILLGVIFYFTMSEGDVLSMLQIKYHAENAVFVSIVFVLCVAVLYLVMIRKSVRVFRELEKISQLSHQGRYYSGDFTRRLGKLGDRIDHLFLELNNLNEAKSLKIGVISETNRFLLQHCELRLCIVDVKGAVQYCSSRFVEGLRATMNDVLGKNIADLVQDLRFEERLREIEREHGSLSAGRVTVRMGEQTFEAVLELIPVYDTRGRLELVLCTVEKEGILSEVAQKAERMQEQVSKAKKRFTDVLTRKRKNSG
jgi:transcriptional regulator with PAS, ATPase and Fis domain